MRNIIISLFFTCLCLAGCRESLGDLDMENRHQQNRMTIRSAAKTVEDVIVDMNVYVYSEGVLYADAFTGGETVVLDLPGGKAYNIYALANVGEVTAPYNERDLSDIECDFPYADEGYLPMCCREGRSVDGLSVSAVTIPMTRLVSKVTLSLDELLENCSLDLESVSVMQAAVSVRPFAGASRAESTFDGPCADVEQLKDLAAGRKVSFYVLENCQGVLLPDNDDPWAKEPDSIPDAAVNCTYLSLKGIWTTPGASADLSVRLFLGADNCTDFNVVRNVNIDIALSISDSGTVKSRWKSSLDNLDDSRNLKFKSSVNVVYQEEGWSAIPLAVEPSDMTFYAQLSDIQDMECKVEAGKVYVKGLYQGDMYPRAQLDVWSWDGMHKSSTYVNLSYHDSELSGYDISIPRYVGEYGHVTFPDASPDSPVRVSTSGPTWEVGVGGVAEGYEDSYAGMKYWFLPSVKTVYMRRISAGESSMLSFKQFKSSAAALIPSGKIPTMKTEDAFISEAGCHLIDFNSLYYDSEIELYLSADDGSKVDLGGFATPPDLLEHMGLSSDDAFDAFERMYGIPTYTTNISPYGEYVCDAVDKAGRKVLYERDNIIQRIKLYGVADRPSGNMDLYFDIACGSRMCHSKVDFVEAFPSQRYMGDVYNYQIAPGDMRSLRTEVDFTDGGKYYAPPKLRVGWQIMHTTSSLQTSLEDAYAAGIANSAYCSAASMVQGELRFKNMSASEYPSCGSMVIRGELTNPHSGKKYVGYYRFDLVLFTSLGCQFEVVNPTTVSIPTIGVSFVPFCEFSKKSMSALWTKYFPTFIAVTSTYNLKTFFVKVSSNTTDYFFTDGSADYKPNAMFPNMAAGLSGHKEVFEFGIDTFKNGRAGEFVCDRAGFQNYPSPEMKAHSDGRKGYYHFVRQYDLNNIPAAAYNYGLDNYLVEAAYGNNQISTF